jgi:histidinol phosphatase-like enzyme (inositol monophosphatase family)
MRDLDEIIKFCRRLLVISGKIISSHYRKDLKVEDKHDHSPVTIADKNAEKSMRHLIRKRYPEDGILGEEFGHFQAEADYQWVLDPIDGTKTYICGVPLFGTLIALLYKSKPIVGVMHLPILKEQLIGTPSQTFLNNKKVEMRECPKMSDAVLLTTDHLQISQFQDGKKFEQLIKKVKLYRTWGDCFGYYLLASGFADIMVDPVMKLWDSAAIIPIIQGAGGIVSDYQGNDLVKGNSLIAAHPSLHEQIVSLLN